MIDFLRGIGNFLEKVIIMEDEYGEQVHEGEMADPSGRLHVAFTFAIKTGLDDRKPLAPVRKKASQQRLTVEEEIHPLVDIFDEGSFLLVIVELPAVDEKDIHITINGDVLLLSATSGSRSYSREVILPDDVDSSTATSAYKHGVLKIRMNKKRHDHSTESRRGSLS